MYLKKEEIKKTFEPKRLEVGNSGYYVTQELSDFYRSTGIIRFVE
jgi:hypothetical protein